LFQAVYPLRYKHTYQKIKVRSNLETNWLSAACINTNRAFEGSARKTVEISARIRRADARRLWLCGRERAMSFGCELNERGGCEVSGVEYCMVTYCPECRYLACPTTPAKNSLPSCPFFPAQCTHPCARARHLRSSPLSERALYTRVQCICCSVSSRVVVVGWGSNVSIIGYVGRLAGHYRDIYQWNYPHFASAYEGEAFHDRRPEPARHEVVKQAYCKLHIASSPFC